MTSACARVLAGRLRAWDQASFTKQTNLWSCILMEQLAERAATAPAEREVATLRSLGILT